MRLKFIFLGRTKSPYLAAGIEDYLTRIRAYQPAEEAMVKAAKVEETRVSEVIAEDTKRLLAAVKPDEVFGV